jgi:hypothetical protein
LPPSVSGCHRFVACYNRTCCFETFPFPVATADQQRDIREAAQALDDHRKARLELHPDLSMTGLYNVLEKLRSGAELSAADQDVNNRGLVSSLKVLHDALDALVVEGYGWPAELPTPEVLSLLAALNVLHAAEERQGIVKYLRPEYQNPNWTGQDGLLAVDEAAAAKLPMFPKRLAEQSQVVRQLMYCAKAGGP